ncbi:MAG: SDR family NAD(P)-dependent oxidoreductase [Gammaproteobacteria bacterium]|nr:SDR family NAD(P)-dependent oxidoreductase [Gammaproteobacteria bacterium]
MEDFQGKIAVVTGGGTGMGRELVRQLATQGCHVASCDVIDANLNETLDLVRSESPDVRVSGHHCDVGIEEDIVRFANEVQEEHETSHINLLFNNAGIGGAGSFINDPRENWERTFNICWNGVYWCLRAFLPLLKASEEAHVVNTSSVNGFWASIGSQTPHTAYSAAKFAVKGLSEALITDFRLNAPHIGVSVVMPGHIGTSIASNSQLIMSGKSEWEFSPEQVKRLREWLTNSGEPVHNESDQQIIDRMKQRMNFFRDNAPTTAAEASGIILDGVKQGRWRILVGDDAHRLDERVRNTPEKAYDEDFFYRII